MYEEFINLVSSVGFPIAVSVYLLVRFEKVRLVARQNLSVGLENKTSLI